MAVIGVFHQSPQLAVIVNPTIQSATSSQQQTESTSSPTRSSQPTIQIIQPTPLAVPAQPAQSQTFTTPSGAVINNDGSVISTPQQPTPQETPAQAYYNPGIGKQFYIMNHDCNGLTGQEYTDCETYGSSQTNESQPTSQDEIAAEEQSCANQLNAINEQISDVKVTASQQLSNIGNSPVPLETQEARAQLEEAQESQQINQLIAEGEQIQLKCNAELETLSN